ncbi:MAG: DUF4143 domain-containing protein [Oligoflexia bacterium]|nr:DUF4143 domain-containing protein [Oligoflexia bacterium]
MLNTTMQLQWKDIHHFDQLIHKGIMAEQFVAQHLYLNTGKSVSPELHYWPRDKKRSNAEVDFVISRDQEIIPIEVKSGTSGQLKSLHQLVHERKFKMGIKFGLNLPSEENIDQQIMDKDGKQRVTYLLKKYPLYLIDTLF